jgi:hypothetical protein
MKAYTVKKRCVENGKIKELEVDPIPGFPHVRVFCEQAYKFIMKHNAEHKPDRYKVYKYWHEVSED